MEIGGGGNREMGMPSNRETLDPVYRPRSDRFPSVGSDSEPAPVPPPTTSYRECQKNHAAAKGGHVLDGCGEFMPSGDEGALKCAACECHRNFHRKETGGGAIQMMAFGESSSEDLQRQRQASGSRKRFRTKFTQEQKEKMMGFAHKLGWKIQKQHDNRVHQFCHDLGLNRQVFKVWMHNNKPNTNKKP